MKTSSQSGIPLLEFVQLLREAEQAASSRDVERVLAINERINEAGYSLVTRNGEVHLKNNVVDQ